MKESLSELLKTSKKALLSEIKTLQDVPAQLHLRDGRKVGKLDRTYRFEGGTVALRFAEKISARTPAETSETESEKKGELAELVSIENNEVVLKLSKDYGDRIQELELEWENDFVPRKTLEEIEFISDNAEARKKAERLASDEPGELERGKSEEAYNIITDQQRNASQIEAIEKAMKRSRLLIWGPPGTGKQPR